MSLEDRRRDRKEREERERQERQDLKQRTAEVLKDIDEALEP